ncbi:hypothetical protein Ddye_017706 [Dipteronia dyeriana]|uniref:Reverse transcriptase domain-containing protein n=1 Tax=Dipteronia dyeriana TaxID=168575 RepID=A0AAD9U9Y7_9ROSI|nr:hypothetical protein Ddye_017706 [Dipteronia dyeriana]
MERGLRQSDSLSPFLFNFVVEGLNCLLKKALQLDLICKESFDDNKVHITHLQFVDDTILFLKPRKDYLLNTKRVLWCFEMASGLKIIFFKSCAVIMGIGKAWESAQWASIFRCKEASLPISYLGFPLRGRPKSFWNLLVDRTEKRLANWKRKLLSREGRLVLIKAVLSNIPIYFLSVFKMPVGVAKRIEMMQGNFL